MKGLIDTQEWIVTDIGDISDFFSPDIEDKFDLPFYYVRRQKASGNFLDIGFPQLFKWEIKCLLQPTKDQLNFKQLEILNQKILKYLVINPVRSMKDRKRSAPQKIYLTVLFGSNQNSKK